MSRKLVAASSMFLNTTASPVTSLPFSFSIWVNPATLASANRGAIFNDQSGAVTNYWGLYAPDNNNKVALYASSALNVESASTMTLSVWNHVAGVVPNGSAAKVYLNGVSATGSNSGAPASLNEIRIGAVNSSGAVNFMDGTLSEAAVWNVALSDSDVTALNAGISPLLIQPGGLVGYWPMWGDDSPEPDWSPQGTHLPLTLNSSPTKDVSNAPVIPLWAMPGSPFTAQAYPLSLGITNLSSLTAGLSFSGALSRQVSYVRTLTGTLSFIGAVAAKFAFGANLKERTVQFISPDRTVLPQ